MIAWLSSVMLLSASARDGDRFAHAAQLERDVHERGARGAQDDTRPLVLLEVRRDDLDAVGARSEVGRLVAALRVGLDACGCTFVDSSTMRTVAPVTTASLRIDDRAAQRAEE